MALAATSTACPSWPAGCTARSALVAAVVADAARPSARVAYVMTDGAALPLALSRPRGRPARAGAARRDRHRRPGLRRRPRGGQRAVGARPSRSRARGRRRGHRGRWARAWSAPGRPSARRALEVAPIVDAAAALGGQPIVAARTSEADPRPRHQGVSHHTTAALRLAARAGDRRSRGRARPAFAVPPPHHVRHGRGARRGRRPGPGRDRRAVDGPGTGRRPAVLRHHRGGRGARRPISPGAGYGAARDLPGAGSRRTRSRRAPDDPAAPTRSRWRTTARVAAASRDAAQAGRPGGAGVDPRHRRRPGRRPAHPDVPLPGLRHPVAVDGEHAQRSATGCSSTSWRTSCTTSTAATSSCSSDRPASPTPTSRTSSSGSSACRARPWSSRTARCSSTASGSTSPTSDQQCTDPPQNERRPRRRRHDHRAATGCSSSWATTAAAASTAATSAPSPSSSVVGRAFVIMWPIGHWGWL